jgi:hypothetical protein
VVRTFFTKLSQAEASRPVERGILRLVVARQLLSGGEFTRLLFNT